MIRNISFTGRATCCAFFLTLTLGVHSVNAQGTAIGYQGRLNTNGIPVTGLYDFRFTVFDSVGNPGGIIAGPLTNSTTGVTNGLFSATLDFGPGVFTGPPRWLEIAVRPVGGTFTNMTPREPLLATPYAVLAGTASNVVSGSVVKSISVGANTLKDNITLMAGTNLTITPSGNTLMLSAVGTGGGGIWSVLNNNAYFNSGNVGIGTTTPTAALDVRGSLTLETGGSATLFTGTGSLELNRYLNLINSPNAASASGLKAGGLLVADSYSYANPGKNDLMVKGKIGVGSATLGGAALNAFGNWDGDDGALTLRGDKPSLRFKGSFVSGDVSWLMHVGSDGPGNLQFYNRDDLALPSPAWNSVMTMTTAGHVGINTTIPNNNMLEIVGQNALGLIGNKPYLTLYDDSAGYAKSRIQGVGGEIIFEPETYVNGSNPNAFVRINSSGNISVASVTIRGGADLAEPFELSANDIPNGAVVVIDDEQAGKLKLSAHAYDCRVAGIVSGANGIHPGISLQQEGVLARGQNVALSGRVYVQADAAFGAIKPGDLLTTSDTPGHAMKVTDHARAQGAILGKAMSNLNEGKGLVLVLVTLQ